MIDLEPRLVAAARTLSQELVTTYGTDRARSIEVGHVYVQCASERDQLLVELPSNNYLQGPRRLPESAEDLLVTVGFSRPEEGFPNWHICLDDPTDCATVAAQAICALNLAYDIPAATIATSLGVPALITGDPPPFEFECDADGYVHDVDQLVPGYAAHILLSRGEDTYQDPHDSDVPPQWFLIVDAISPNSVIELIALAPRGPANSTATWFRRIEHGWVVDDHRARMAAESDHEHLRPTTEEMVANVLPQINAYFAERRYLSNQEYR